MLNCFLNAYMPPGLNENLNLSAGMPGFISEVDYVGETQSLILNSIFIKAQGSRCSFVTRYFKISNKLRLFQENNDTDFIEMA